MEEECTQYPCLHVGVDHRNKTFAVFIETADGEYIYLPLKEIEKIMEKIAQLRRKHYREAVGDEIDRIAYDVLGLVEIEYE